MEGWNNMRIFVLLLLFSGVPLLSVTPVFADDAKAQEILKQARSAIGGQEQLQKIQSLKINGQYRRLLGDRQMDGDREVSIVLPNKYLVEDSFSPGGLSTAMINTRALNGEQAWNSSSGGGGGMVFRMGAPGGQQATAEQMELIFRRQYQAELTRYLMAILLMPPDSFPVDYKYAGESDVDDAHAEVIDISGPDKFAMRVFFDKESHMPLLVSYRGIKPRIMTMNRSAAPNVKPEEAMKKAREDAEKKMAAEASAKPEEVDLFIRLADHNTVNRELLLYNLTFLTQSEVSEEVEISKYQLNPQFKSARFSKH